ncbi:hypothetical protein [Mastigocoleus testarum]|uniref:hypothetical protein n=1 Tax=Mastigocoleus testarum TaxID=996925 RepID=UPI00137A0FC7|nr:hypothetical protein [Mastigocoleus testarum]MDJ0774723.1 hypothetical protein [Mastigocoleus sp. MO_167.B18]
MSSRSDDLEISTPLLHPVNVFSPLVCRVNLEVIERTAKNVCLAGIQRMLHIGCR